MRFPQHTHGSEALERLRHSCDHNYGNTHFATPLPQPGALQSTCYIRLKPNSALSSPLGKNGVWACMCRRDCSGTQILWWSWWSIGFLPFGWRKVVGSFGSIVQRISRNINWNHLRLSCLWTVSGTLVWFGIGPPNQHGSIVRSVDKTRVFSTQTRAKYGMWNYANSTGGSQRKLCARNCSWGQVGYHPWNEWKCGTSSSLDSTMDIGSRQETKQYRMTNVKIVQFIMTLVLINLYAKASQHW